MEVANGLSQNLSDINVTRRLRAGIVMLGVALAMAAVFEKMDVSPYTRLWLFIPFFVAENAFFQAIYKTCGFSAMQGMRHTSEGEERIGDAQARSACKCTGRKQIVQAVLSAAVLTAVFVWIA